MWKPRKIANPKYYKDDTPLANIGKINAVAIEIWTMDSGFYFDNIVVANDPADVVASPVSAGKFAAGRTPNSAESCAADKFVTAADAFVAARSQALVTAEATALAEDAVVAVVAVVAQVGGDEAEVGRGGRRGQVRRQSRRARRGPRGQGAGGVTERHHPCVALGRGVDDRVEVHERVVPGRVPVGRLGRGRLL